MNSFQQRPEPAPEQKQRKTIHQDQDFKIEKYLEALEIDEANLNKTIEWMCNQVNSPKEPLEILVIGPGTGRLEVPFLEALCNKNKLNILFMDYSQVSNRELRNVINSKKWKTNTHLRDRLKYQKIEEQDFETYEFKGNKYDVIVAFFVINFFSDWTSGLKKIFSLMNDGGQLFISQDTKDICFLDNTFIPLDSGLEKDLSASQGSNDRAIFYRLWREYYRRRDDYGYAWNPLISPSDMGLVVDIFHKLHKLDYGTVESCELEWKHKELSWEGWIDIIEKLQVFNCLCVIPAELRKRLAKEIKDWLIPPIKPLQLKPLKPLIDKLSDKPDLKFGHRITCYQKPYETAAKSFDKISGYVVEAKYEKSLFKRLSHHEPFNLEVILEETRLEDQIRRLINTHSQLPLKENIALSLVSWILEDLGDHTRGGWSNQVPLMLPEQFDGNIQNRKQYCTSYAIYMCLQKFREEMSDDWYMVSEILIHELPDNVTINFSVNKKENVNVEYNRNGTVKSIKIDLSHDKVLRIRKQASDVSKGAITYCSAPCAGPTDNDHLFEYPNSSMHWFKSLLDASALIWNEKKADISSLFESIRAVSTDLKNVIYSSFEETLKYEWDSISFKFEKLAESLAVIGYANTIVGAGSDNEWSEALFVPARTFLHQKDFPQEKKISWEVGLLGFICYFSPKDSVNMSEDTMLDWTMIQNLLGANVNLYSLEDTVQQYAKLIRNETLKSAIAAIMARNMDHLLGSHIETGIAHQMPHLRKEISLITGNNVVDDNYFRDDFWIQPPPGFDRDPKIINLSKHRREIDQIIHHVELQYSNYRLKRMDLIARFSTEWISWGVGMSFFYQVMFPFMNNLILLHFLGHGENLHLSNLDIHVCYPDGDCLCCFEQECLEHRVIMKDSNNISHFYNLAVNSSQQNECNISGVPDDVMKIRGGDIGAHAFHIILENILRNSAKHRYTEYKQKQVDRVAQDKLILKIWVIGSKEGLVLKNLKFQTTDKRFNCADPDQAFWHILISVVTDFIDTDKDTDDETTKLAEKIDDYLRKKIITSTGQTDPSTWGMKEKKICAAFLNYKTTFDTNDDKPDYIGAGTVKWPDGIRRLAYWLKIPKAKYLLYIENDEGVCNDN